MPVRDSERADWLLCVLKAVIGPHLEALSSNDDSFDSKQWVSVHVSVVWVSGGLRSRRSMLFMLE